MGLIRPAVFTKVFKKEINRKNILTYFGGAMTTFFILFLIFSEPSTIPTVIPEREQAVLEQEEETQKVEEEVVVQEKELEQPGPITETPSVESTTSQPQIQQPPPQEQIQSEPEPETQQSEPEPEQVSDGKKWYVSSHWSSQYYYCEESDGWKGLSPTYLRVYTSEVALVVDFPNHTLHESCQ